MKLRKINVRCVGCTVLVMQDRGIREGFCAVKLTRDSPDGPSENGHTSIGLRVTSGTCRAKPGGAVYQGLNQNPPTAMSAAILPSSRQRLQR